jgi:hypothetical protein
MMAGLGTSVGPVRKGEAGREVKLRASTFGGRKFGEREDDRKNSMPLRLSERHMIRRIGRPISQAQATCLSEACIAASGLGSHDRDRRSNPWPNLIMKEASLEGVCKAQLLIIVCVGG